MFWKYDFNLLDSSAYTYVSQPLCSPHSTRITVSDGKHVFSVIIPKNNESPSIRLLSDSSPYFLLFVRIGINKMFAYYAKHSCTINYVWPDDESTSSGLLQRQPVHIQSWRFDLLRGPMFDKRFGRVVIQLKKGWTILDFTVEQYL